MKKLTLLFTTVALLGPSGASECLADYKDIANQVETVANFWIGGSYNDTKSSINNSLAEERSTSQAAGRVGTNKASEYYAMKSSGSGGVLLTGAPLPNRYHLEFDYYNDNDWFGDLRYSFKDYLQLRLLPRRFTHNLDNVTVFDFNPTVANFTPPATYNTNGNDVDTLDALVDDYRLRVDIDEYRLRLKTPNYPLHVYTNGEVVRKKGTRQVHFLGGNGTRTGNRAQVRATSSREVEQETKTFVVGTNTHTGPLEFDISHRERRFKSDLDTPTHRYDFGTTILHVIPELKAKTNTIKVHTSHTGRVFASTTFSETKKANEYSGAEAEMSSGYGEIAWVPAAYFTLVTKFRHQKNEATTPAATVAGANRLGGTTNYNVKPGIKSQTDTAIVAARYSLIPKTSANLQYTWQVKDVEGEQAVALGRPHSTTKNIYELGFTNWAIPHVRTTAKFSHTDIGNNYGDTVANYEPVSIDPEHTNQGTLGITWQVSPKITAFASGSISKEESDNNRLVGGHIDSKAEALNQQGMFSLNFALSEKFSLSPSYTYMSWEQKRDLVWDGNGTEVVDPAYTNKQKAQVFALALNSTPTKRLNVNAAVEYIITEGRYNPTSPFRLYAAVPAYNTAEAAEFSRTDTEEWNVRLDSEFDLGRGWGLGLDLRYVDWEDTSTDNPSDGIYYGGLFKVSKKLFY